MSNNTEELLKKYGIGSFDETALDELESDLAKDTFAKIMKWNVGRNVVRIVPQPNGRKLFERAKVHFVKRPDGKTVAFACAVEHHSKVCFGCTMQQRAQQAGREEQAKELRARPMYYFAGVRRGEETLGPQLGALSRTQMDELRKKIKLHREQLAEIGEPNVDVFHPVTGYDVIVEREGTQRDDTEYSISLGMKPRPLASDFAQLEAWLAMIPDNLKPRELKSDAEIRTMLGATPAEGGSAKLPAAPRSIESDAAGDDEYGDDEYSDAGGDNNIPF